MAANYAQIIDSENDENFHEAIEFQATTGYYNDFETIDWLKEINRDRKRHKDLKLKPKSFLTKLLWIFDNSSGWLCVILVGVMTGLTASIVNIGSVWIFDLKIGVCKDTFWLNKEQCCWNSNYTDMEKIECDEWYSWSRLFSSKLNATGNYFVDYSLFVLWALLFSLLAVAFIVEFAPYACGSGIPEIKTILGGFIIRDYLEKWTLLIKSVGMMLVFSSGLCLGKEGPMIHMAVCWGNIVSYFFPKYGSNEAKKREIMSASVAAGIAAAFGSPVGGVVFSLEEASYYFPLKTMFRSFLCALVSANIVRLMNPFGEQNLVLFHLDYTAQWHAIEIIPFAFIGILGGLFGIVFNKCNIWICRKRKTTLLGKFPCLEVFLVTLLTAIISFPQIYMNMSSEELIRSMVRLCRLEDDIPLCDYTINTSDTKRDTFGSYVAGPGVIDAMKMLSLALFCKIVLSIYSFGMKVPCGLFIPSLTIGSLIGRIVGVLVEQLAVRYKDINLMRQMCSSSEPCINPGLYAVVGAAACLGGVTRITVSLVVIMLEITGGSSYILPLMVGTMVSKWSGDMLTHSIYEEHIQLNDYPFLPMENEFLDDKKVEDIMTPHTIDQPLQLLTENSMTVADIRILLKMSDVKGYPVIDSNESKRIVGMVSKAELTSAIKKLLEYNNNSIVSFSNYKLSSTFCQSISNIRVVDLRSILDSSLITLFGSTPVESAFDFFVKLGIQQILVTGDGRLTGIITKKDILTYLKKSHIPVVKKIFCC